MKLAASIIGGCGDTSGNNWSGCSLHHETIGGFLRRQPLRRQVHRTSHRNGYLPGTRCAARSEPAVHRGTAGRMVGGLLHRASKSGPTTVEWRVRHSDAPSRPGSYRTRGTTAELSAPPCYRLANACLTIRPLTQVTVVISQLFG